MPRPPRSALTSSSLAWLPAKKSRLAAEGQTEFDNIAKGAAHREQGSACAPAMPPPGARRSREQIKEISNSNNQTCRMGKRARAGRKPSHCQDIAARTATAIALKPAPSDLGNQRENLSRPQRNQNSRRVQVTLIAIFDGLRAGAASPVVPIS